MIVGYARVSTDGQTPDAPYAALAAAEKVFAEKTSEARCCAKARAGFRSLAERLGRYHDAPLVADAHGAERIGGI